MTTFLERLELAFKLENIRRAESGAGRLTKTELWKAAGASSGAATHWFNGSNGMDLATCVKVAMPLGCSPFWLYDGTGKISDGILGAGGYPFDSKLLPLSNTQGQSQQSQSWVSARHPDDALPDDMIEVMESRVSFSAGNGHTPNYTLIEEREPATYRMSWFQRERINPEYVRRFKVTGDSMEPFLYSGDTILVNLAENDATRILDGKVYAIRYGEELRVKRLFRHLNGTLTLRSENPAYKDEDVEPEIAEEHITIIGRVRDKSGSGGL